MRSIARCFVLILFVCVSPSVFYGSTLLIRNAVVIDGTGRASYKADVRIKGDTIINIGRLRPKKGEEVIDAEGLVLSPGFIDIHNHSEEGLLEEGTAANQVSQGITTILIGPDGGSPYPIRPYLERLKGKIATNVGSFIGHATLRSQVLKGDYLRPATDEEIRKMTALAAKSMKEGAFGLSSGLEYDVGFSASTEELIAIAKAARKFGGIYMTHLRDEEEGLLDAIKEAVRIGIEAKVPVQISHIKAGNRNVWGMSKLAIELIEGYRSKGVDVTADAYPYTAWASTITVLVPSRKHDDRNEVENGLNNVGGAEKVLVTSCKAHRDYEGKTLKEIALAKGVSPVDVYIEIVKDGGAGVVCDSMDEADVKAFYQQPWVMVSSDGGIGSRHPRGSGTFTRVLGRLVRADGWLTLEEAVRKMTYSPAARIGLSERGRIAKRLKADLVLFDPESVIDRATFDEPRQLSEGIVTVMVNGRRVWNKGKVTGALPGSVLRKK